jgi:hypothetical protein
MTMSLADVKDDVGVSGLGATGSASAGPGSGECGFVDRCGDGSGVNVAQTQNDAICKVGMLGDGGSTLQARSRQPRWVRSSLVSQHWRHASGTLIVAVLLLLPSLAFADDRVTVATGNDNAGRRTLQGTITDFNGKELRIETSAGQPMTVPAARVIDVQTTWTPAHAEGDRLLAEHKFAEALTSYREANGAENRLWAKRRIMAQVVTCYEALGQFDRAGDAFVLLMKTDEHWQYYERIPLAWTSSLTDVALAQRAKAWLAAEALPPVQLLGASWSIAGEQRTTALASLRQLSASTDPRLAHLADAQVWRANVATVGPQELQAWEAQIERMPINLRSGPYLVLGKGWLQQDARMLGPSEPIQRRAAWAFLKPPILTPERAAHAVEGLTLAAGPLVKLKWDDEAHSVLRELATTYPDTDAGKAAAERLAREVGAKKP